MNIIITTVFHCTRKYCFEKVFAGNLVTQGLVEIQHS